MPVPLADCSGKSLDDAPSDAGNAAAFHALHQALQEQQALMERHFQKLQESFDLLAGQLSEVPFHLEDHDYAGAQRDESADEMTMVVPKLKRRQSQFQQISINAENEELKEQALTAESDVQEVVMLHERKPWLQTLVAHPGFEIFFGFAIALNVLLIGLEVSFAATSPDAPKDTLRGVMLAFSLLFLVELVIRLMCSGRAFFCNKDFLWNWLDIILVTASMWEALVELARELNIELNNLSGLSAMRVIRILRITRLVKIFRVARLMRFVKALRMLISSVANTMKPLLWALVLLTLLTYIFGILFTSAVTEYLQIASLRKTISSEAITAIERYWFDLPPSMLTLFMCITGGVSWEVPLFPLSEISDVWTIVFLVYISFSYLAVLNVVTGVFCEGAIQAVSDEQEIAMQSIMENKKGHIAKLKQLFNLIDENGSGTITLAEFEHHVKDEAVMNYFEMLELEVQDAWQFFSLLDADGGNGIDVDEFLQGCLQMRGGAKALELARLQREHHWLVKKQTDFMGYVEEHLDLIEDLNRQLVQSASRYRIVRQPTERDQRRTRTRTRTWQDEPVGRGLANSTSSEDAGEDKEPSEIPPSSETRFLC